MLRKPITALAGAFALLTMACASQGAVTINVVADDGISVVTNYAPLSVVTTPISAPFGSTIGSSGPFATPLVIPFSPTAGFVATASNASGGQTSETDGKLDLLLIFSQPTQLALTISEGGTWSTTGGGTVNLLAGVVIREASSSFPLETFGGLLSPTFNGNGTWSANGFFASQGAYTTYHLSLDNGLIAEALGAANGSSATIRKTAFSIEITEGGAPIPEPASLSVLALGGLALLARRKR